MTLPVHTIDSAPDKARPTLEAAHKGYGFVPNLLGVMASAPALAKAYPTLAALFDESAFDATERQVVLLTASAENGCGYCMAAHSVIAGMQKVPEDVVAALRDGQPIADPKLEALRRFTASVVTKRGRPSESDKQAFLDAGYAVGQMLDVALGVGLKTLSNYTNHLADTPLDTAFASAEWSHAA